MRWPMCGSLNSPRCVMSSATCRVVPLIVRSPLTVNLSPPWGTTPVLAKVISGYFSTSRKVDDNTSLSRCALLVLRLATWMVTCTEEVSGWSGSMSAVAATSAKWPRTVIIPRCFAENSTCVWYGSSCQLPMTTYLPVVASLSASSGYLRVSDVVVSISCSGGNPQHRPAAVPGEVDMICVGTSGWMYDDWRGPFYPAGVPRSAWLEFYARHFATVEINNAFYRLPERDTFEGWRQRVGDDFRFAVKMSRYLSHIKRLRDPAEPVARFMSRVTALGDRLGPVLLQMPPTMRRDPALLDAALAEVPAGTRVAVEPRHESWWRADVRGVLEARGAALVWAD